MGVEAALVAATIVSAAAATYGAYESYQTGKYNQKVAEADAAAREQKAAYDADLHRARVRRLISAQRALYGKSGVELSGSPLLVLEDTAAQGELDALAIQFGGNVDASRLRSEGRLARRKGTAGAVAGIGKAGTTLLSGYGRSRQSQIEKGEVG